MNRTVILSFLNPPPRKILNTYAIEYRGIAFNNIMVYITM